MEGKEQVLFLFGYDNVGVCVSRWRTLTFAMYSRYLTFKVGKTPVVVVVAVIIMYALAWFSVFWLPRYFIFKNDFFKKERKGNAKRVNCQIWFSNSQFSSTYKQGNWIHCLLMVHHQQKKSMLLFLFVCVCLRYFDSVYFWPIFICKIYLFHPEIWYKTNQNKRKWLKHYH